MKKKRLLIIFMLLFVLFIASFTWLLLQEERYQYGYTRNYQFDPLKLNNEDLEFVLINENDVESNKNLKDDYFFGKEEDFYLLVNKFYELVLLENASFSKLDSIEFSTLCDNVNSGFYSSYFTYSKIENVDGKKVRVHRYVFIDLQSKTLRIIEEYIEPVILIWNKINLSKIKYSASDVLELTDRNGGSDQRQTVNNNCYVRVGMFPDSAEFRGWSVSYIETYSEKNEQIVINEYDPFTGELLPSEKK
ncbi:MAG: hypothetical protein CVU39_18065 [Chloroflexi bacterium HGW-Chloroflexi-10]|nr:MAG: hypothetical protein CVU39_18065 [Chloroflexi bacterium HGW-Chloroflexi-10]